MARYESTIVFRGLDATINRDENGDRVLQIVVPTVEIPKVIPHELRQLELRDSQIEEVCELVSAMSAMNYLIAHRER